MRLFLRTLAASSYEAEASVRSYTAAFKLKVIDIAEKIGNFSAQTQFDVNEKQV